MFKMILNNNKNLNKIINKYKKNKKLLINKAIFHLICLKVSNLMFKLLIVKKILN